MRAMIMVAPHRPLRLSEVPKPKPTEDQALVRVLACAVCRTDLHVLDGELANPKLPLIPGHEIVGRVWSVGPNGKRFKQGDRVGVAWLAWACGKCRFCKRGQENLCDRALFTGYTVN